MASKKHRKKLKARYNTKKPVYRFLLTREAQEDRETILNFLEANANITVSSNDIMTNNHLNLNSSSSVYHNIKYIRENMDINIISIRGKGYQYQQ